MAAAKKCIKEWFGDDPKKSEDLARIVSDRHFDRLVKLIENSKDKIAFGKCFRKY
jgi:aldehyde dehydrogenase (NAD+)